jgi:hypothetical protein
MQGSQRTQAFRARSRERTTAYCPQRRNWLQDLQSVAIFSGSHACGTIENPR